MILGIALAARPVSAEPTRAQLECGVHGTCCFMSAPKIDPLNRLRTKLRHKAVVGLPKVEAVAQTKALPFPAIKRVVRRHSEELAACYPRRLPASVGEGRVGLQLAIMPTGNVELVGALGFDAEVTSCMAAVIAKVRFPVSANGDVTHAFVPIRIETE